jgi:hypothetical protein
MHESAARLTEVRAHACAQSAPPLKSSLGEGQDRRFVPPPFFHAKLQLVSQGVGAPFGAREQPVHTVGPALGREGSQLSSIFAVDRRQETAKVRQRPLAWLGPGEMATNAFVQDVEACPGDGLWGRLVRHGGTGIDPRRDRQR